MGKMMKQVWVCLLLLSASLAKDSRKTSHRRVGPGTPGGPPTQGAAIKKSKIKMIKYKNKWWKIKTRKKHSGSGQDYQNNDSEDKTGDCSSNVHGSVGFAIDTTASMA